MADPKVWKVTELTMALKELIEDGFFPVWISGEVGNLTVQRSGHAYFTLKDSRCQLSAVFFSGAQSIRNNQIKEGTKVELYGRLTVYEARGSYQINVQQIRPKGLGSLMLQFEELKNKLHLEGLFNDSAKKKIPLLPARIAVVTSPEGAALHDFLNVIERRFSNVHIRIFPTSVQGNGAAEKIATQIRNCNYLQAADVIIVTRGGGSLEDLWAFNEEVVARAVAESTIPVISAVGHEVDFSICDFVSDMRVPTPSAAAELVIGRKAHFQEQLDNLKRRLSSNLSLKVTRLRQRLQILSNAHVLKDPFKPLSEKKQYIDDLEKRLADSLSRALEQKGIKLQHLQTKLQLLSPLKVLERGYAIVQYNEKAQTDPENIPDNAKLNIRLAKGNMTAEKRNNS
jgi:exodeoxyribonuclease VII large subunit